jgi:hypothetical protein
MNNCRCHAFYRNKNFAAFLAIKDYGENDFELFKNIKFYFKIFSDSDVFIILMTIDEILNHYLAVYYL